MRCLFVVVALGCGTDVVPLDDGGRSGGDGPPPPGLSVRLTTPNGGEAFYQTEPITVTWIPHDDIAGTIACDVEARGATTIPIASDVGAVSDQASQVTWNAGAVAPGDYRIAVACTDAMARTATDESNATFFLSPPPRAVSFSTELQPILVASCIAANCHDANQPQAGLKLTAGFARAEMVGVASAQCSALQLVNPGAPNESYLIAKLVGNNPGGCYVGTRMPKLAAALTQAQVQAFRDWIANDAPDN